MRVADTSALYAFLDGADAHHAKAKAAVGEPETILVPSEILVETVDLIEYRFGAAAARDALEDLLSLPHVRISEKVSIDAVSAVYLGAKGRLSLADAFVVQTCRATAAAPLSFDKAILTACSP